MVQFPSLEYTLSHPHPYGHWFLLATIVLFLLTTPVLVIVNLVTLGFDLIPSLQPRFAPNNTYLEAWWGTRRLPPLLRPRPPQCQPRDLGRGDNFRVSGSLFDYTVMSTWNTTKGTPVSGIQEQERFEYRGEPFDGCYVNRARYDYSLSAQTNSITVGVLCPGTPAYPIQVSMQSTITYAVDISSDFIGQYYGQRLDLLNVTQANPTDYRRVVLAAIGAVATDATTIMRTPHLPNQPLSMRVVFDINGDSPELIPGPSSLTYANGSQPSQFPPEAFIFTDTIYNLAVVTVDAVNLDLGNHKFSNIFRNITRARGGAIVPNLAPSGISAADWAQPGQDFYYGTIPTQYQTWAQALLDGYPVQLGQVTGLPDQSVMTTSYLCPSYHIKPLRSLLASVFVGSATMTLSVWGAWMVLTTYLARRITAPQVICHCKHCEARREREAAEAAFRAANPPPPGVFGRFIAQIRRARSRKPVDEERANINVQPLDWTPPSGRPTDVQRPSYISEK